MMHARLKVLLSFFLLSLLASACAAKKDTATNHFGVEVHHAKFKGAKDFFGHSAKVNEILYLHKLGGKPVDTSWITPDFREQLCLTVTINNHCVG